MKRLRKTFAIGSTLVALLAGNAKADVSANVSTAVKSAYVGGAGFTVVDNVVVQASAGINAEHFSLETWLNYDPKKENVTEIDIAATVPLGTYSSINASLYGGYFTLPGLKLADSQEVGLTLSSTNLPVDVNLYGAKIFGDESEKGGYASLTVGKTLPLTDNISASASARVGYNYHYFTKTNGISHADLTLSVPISLDSVSITPAVRFLKTDPTKKFDGVFKDQIVGELTFSKRF